MMERAENTPQPLSVFFPSVPVEELTIQHSLLIRPPSSGEGDGGDSRGLMVAASDHPIHPTHPAIQHAVRALTSVGTIAEFFQAADTLRSSGVMRSLRSRGASGSRSSETTVRSYVVAHNAR
jgi:hypothetical protein